MNNGASDLSDDCGQDEWIHSQMTKFAFPGRTMALIGNEEQEIPTPGLTKREYFAAMAMQGILSSIYTNGEGYREQLETWKELYPGDISVKQAVALDALAYADELLKQLK